MKKIVYAVLLVAMASLCSCKFAGKLAGKAADQISQAAGQTTPMDEESTYKAVEEALAKIEPKWKIYKVKIHNDGMAEMCQNNFGWCYAYMIDAENQQIRQSILPEIGSPDPESTSLSFDKVPALGFTAAQAVKNIDECKKMIPEAYKFLNLEDYDVEYNDRKEGVITAIKINVQEIGKEKIEANGSSEEVYYSLNFEVLPDGTVHCKELEN